MTSKVTYSVARVAPDEARDELARLWGSNLTIDGGVDRKFAWLYREAPEPPDGVFLLGADQDGDRRWVGTAGVGLRRVWAGGRELRAGLLADLAVDREHRTVMPALALVRAVKSWALGSLDLAYGFPNKHAEGVFGRVGYKPLGRMGRWARVLRHAGYMARVMEMPMARVPARVKRVVDRAASVPAIAMIAGRAVDAARLVKVTGAALAAARGLKLTWTERPDDRIDAIWEAARDGYEAVGVRSSRFLAWRFPKDVQIVIASRRSDGAPRAYAVIERDADVAHLRDLFGVRDDLGALLDLLIPALYARGHVAVSMRYLGPRWFVVELESRGFVERVSGRMVSLGVRDGLAPEPFAGWYLTDADEDT